ncbi:competence protein CoiA [Arthrobacter sp. NPDC093125]|uniref:competence protein CoiA n=1 Tax=Arthrobacter sp. NPDC093125 TaxID=3363944 RepID=UPI00380E0301
MPLIAILDGERVDASKHSRESWTELKQSDQLKRMVMPLCGIRAIAKSRGATFFFAHHRIAECNVDHGGESPQHLAMKAALRDRINSLDGWHAVLEYPHPSREWIIDVLAESDEKRHRVAFEVQLSSQTPGTYHLRSQRYFNDGVFPVWIIPRPLDYSPIKIPIVVTGFGKSSEVPEHPAELMNLNAFADFSTADTLGLFVDSILERGPGWGYGSPDEQIAAQRREVEREARVREEERRRLESIETRIEEMNSNSASPETAYGAHTVHTEEGPFVWATMTQCWSCEHPLLLWNAQSARPGVQHTSAPPLALKREVGVKRYENHPDVHKVLNIWMRATQADVEKALIKTRLSKTKAAEYSAFVCLECDALIGQMFISCIRVEKWSLISAPLLKRTRTDTKQPTHPDPRKGKRQKQRPPIHAPVVTTYEDRPAVPDELQTDRKKTWAELHSPEGIAEARRRFMGKAYPYRGK